MGWGRKKYREEQTSPSPQALLSGWVSSLSPLASKNDSSTVSSKACGVGMQQAVSYGMWQGRVRDLAHRCGSVTIGVFPIGTSFINTLVLVASACCRSRTAVRLGISS